MGTTPPLLPIYYSQLPSPRYAFAFRLRVSPIYGFERERTKVCYEFVVVGGRVRNYQASKLGLACQLPPPPLHPPYLPFVQVKGSPLPSVFSNSIRRKKRKGGGKGGKQKRRNREYLHSPTPFPLPIISLLWTRDEKLERLKKKQASKQGSKQASKHAARAPTLWPPPYQQSRLTLHSQKLHGWTKTDLSCILRGGPPPPCLNFVSFPFDSIFTASSSSSSRIGRCVALWLTTKWFVDPRSRLSRVTRLNYARPRAWRFIPLSRRQRICNEITSGSDMRRNLTSLSTFRAVNLNSKLSD